MQAQSGGVPPRYTPLATAPAAQQNGVPVIAGPRVTAFKAYAQTGAPPTPPQTLGRAWKVWLVAGDCILIGLAPVLVHLAKNKQGRYSFHPVAVNLLVECTKLTFATIVLIYNGTGRPGVPMYRSARSFLRDAHHNKLLAVPAGLYSINNYLKFAMQLYFKPTTAKMLSNLKILVIAVLMKFILHRSFTVFQWEALLLLVAGITVNQLNYCAKDAAGDTLALAAVLYTLGSVTIPSLASVYNEMALKKHMDTSVHLQNWFLYFFGALFNCFGLLLVVAVGGQPLNAMFNGLGKITMLLVMNNALQGILSSFFFKYADTILKKYSSTVATIFTGIMSALLFGHQLTMNFCIGVTIVGISMHQFFSQGGAKGAGGKLGAGPVSKAATSQMRPFTVSPSMDHIVKLNSVGSQESISSLETSMGDADSMHFSGRHGGPLLPR